MSLGMDAQKKNEELNLTEKLNDFIQKNRIIILIGLAAVVVILAALVITISVRDKIQEKALTNLDDFSRRYDKLKDKFKIDNEGESEDDALRLEETASLLKELNVFAEKASGFASAKAYSLSADINWDMKNWADAEKAWLEAAKRGAKTYLAPVSLYNAAVAAEEQGNSETAISYYNRAFNYGDSFPSAARAQFSIGRLEESRNNKDAAIEAYKKLVGTWPNDTVWSNLAQSRILALQD